tara:strand:+ start:74 stop:565 length:492 start_codon:yes stop_codon:yes gene_type:complete
MVNDVLKKNKALKKSLDQSMAKSVKLHTVVSTLVKKSLNQKVAKSDPIVSDPIHQKTVIQKELKIEEKNKKAATEDKNKKLAADEVAAPVTPIAKAEKLSKKIEDIVKNIDTKSDAEYQTALNGDSSSPSEGVKAEGKKPDEKKPEEKKEEKKPEDNKDEKKV